MVEPPARVFYRLVERVPPTPRDFMSHEALGVLPKGPLSSRARDRWRGVSVHDVRGAVMVKGNDSPWLGGYVAELRVPHGVTVRFEQTGRDPSHYTLWADPAELLSWVVSVEPVEPVH